MRLTWWLDLLLACRRPNTYAKPEEFKQFLMSPLPCPGGKEDSLFFFFFMALFNYVTKEVAPWFNILNREVSS